MSREWLGQALCRVEGHPSWWDLELDEEHPGEREPERRQRWAKAREVCHRCPVRIPCAAAFDPKRDAGMWGGVVHESNSRAQTVIRPDNYGRRTA